MQNVHWNIIGSLDLVETLTLILTHLYGSVTMASAFALTNSNVTTSPSVLKKNQMVYPWEIARPKLQVIL